MTNSNYWPNPKSKSVGLFTDLNLFYEALKLATVLGGFSQDQLKDELGERVKGLIYYKKLGYRAINDLIRELKAFNWIECKNNYFLITQEGKGIYDLFKEDKRAFIKRLIIKMYNEYMIPAWFVNRLWILNSKGQGEVVIPAPLKNWNPRSREWDDKNWNNDLSTQTIEAERIINKICENAFNIPELIWLEGVKNAWERLGNLKRRRVARPTQGNKTKEQMKTYSPRRRLALAMKEAAVKLMFSNQLGNFPPDFERFTKPLMTRTYMAWCPRLESLELIFYTDVHPLLPGRLVFPVSVFSKEKNSDSFEKLEEVKNPNGEFLFLYKPKWDKMKKEFIEILFCEYQKTFLRVKSLYVPLLDVRDEVCRQLRLSANSFDSFMEILQKESLLSNVNYSISLETDIREDQRSGYQMLRRPVWIRDIQYSLLAMTPIKEKSSRTK